MFYEIFYSRHFVVFNGNVLKFVEVVKKDSYRTVVVIQKNGVRRNTPDYFTGVKIGLITM